MLSGTDAYTLLQWMLLVLQIIILWHKVVCIQAYEEGQHKRHYFWKRTSGNITSHLQAVCSLVSVILSTVCVCVCVNHMHGVCVSVLKSVVRMYWSSYKRNMLLTKAPSCECWEE